MTPGAGVQTVGELTELRQTVGPAQLVRINGHRTVSVVFQPPEDMTLDAAISLLESKVEPKVRAGMAPKVQLTYAGSVNDLHQALRAMGQNFLLALVILFALMAALFRSARDSLLVMVVIPVSIAGGILALRVVGLFGFQALDLLTMIGFIILLGLVVNAAILLVDQTRARERSGVPRRQAVAEALETRARPIVLSTLTAEGDEGGNRSGGGHRDAERGGELADGDLDSDAGEEPDQEGPRQEVGDEPQAGQPRHQQHGAGEDRHHRRQLDVLGGADRGQRGESRGEDRGGGRIRADHEMS